MFCNDGEDKHEQLPALDYNLIKLIVTTTWSECVCEEYHDNSEARNVILLSVVGHTSAAM